MAAARGQGASRAEATEACLAAASIAFQLWRTEMKPGYWIGILALAGAILGYALSRGTGWLDAGIGCAVGSLIGTLAYTAQKRKGSPPSA